MGGLAAYRIYAISHVYSIYGLIAFFALITARVNELTEENVRGEVTEGERGEERGGAMKRTR